MKFTEIKISALREGIHSFEFRLDDAFSEAFSRDLFDKPRLEINLDLEVTDRMLTARLRMRGSVEVVCDRSMDTYREPVDVSVRHFFRYGEEEQELSDEMDIISKERVAIDFDQLIYDSVALSLPGRRLHPRYSNETEPEGEGTMVYQSSAEEGKEGGDSDPRWEKLKNVNFQN
jgi:uncharacterized protein